MQECPRISDDRAEVCIVVPIELDVGAQDAHAFAAAHFLHTSAGLGVSARLRTHDFSSTCTSGGVMSSSPCSLHPEHALHRYRKGDRHLSKILRVPLDERGV